MKLLQHVDNHVTKTKFTLLILTVLPLGLRLLAQKKQRLSRGGALRVVADFWLVAPQPHYHLQREVVTQNDNERK